MLFFGCVVGGTDHSNGVVVSYGVGDCGDDGGDVFLLTVRFIRSSSKQSL